MQKPSLGRIVHYRGKFGLQTMRAALVTCTVAELDPLGVESGQIEPLDDDMHVHLWVFTPAASGPNVQTGGFPEFNVPCGELVDGDLPAGSWSWPVRAGGFIRPE
jgi:hypothetical protein